MYIPFYTKYKILKEELDHKEKRIKVLESMVEDLRDEHVEDNLKTLKFESAIIKIKEEIPKQHYGSVKNLGNKILSIIKELDVDQTY